MQPTSTITPAPSPAPHKPRLGEELPIFCEHCGYSLHMLPQVRCDQCSILQFHCPECGHHQPINTLRPAALRIIGRIRALGLAIIVFLKLNFFGWTLFGWYIAGWAHSFTYNSRQLGLDNWTIAGLVFWGAAWGAVSRMLLLRWRAVWVIAPVLAGFVVIAMALGAHSFSVSGWAIDRMYPISTIASMNTITALAVAAGALLVWPLWVLAVRVLLPQRAGQALLDWQRAMSDPKPPIAAQSSAARD